MKFKRNRIKSPKIEVAMKRRVASTRAMSNLKRSRSFRAPTKLISKIRNRRESLDTYNTFKEVKECKEILSNFSTFVDGDLSHDFEKKMQLSPILSFSDKKKKENNNDKNFRFEYNKKIKDNGEIYWKQQTGYENPTFSMDNSLNSSLTNYVFEPVVDCAEDDKNYCKNTTIDKSQLILKENSSQLSIIFGESESIMTKNPLWYEKPNQIVTMPTGDINKSICCANDQRKKNYYETENIPGLSWLTNRATSFRWKNSRDDTSKFQSFNGMEFLEGFTKKKHLNHSSNRQTQNSHHLQKQHTYLTSGALNPLTIQPSLNIHSRALFTAIEHENLEKVRTILDTADIDINSVNNNGLSPLDIAILANNKPLVKILVAHGAIESNEFKCAEHLGSHLRSILLTAEQKLGEMTGNGNNSGPLGTDTTLFLDTENTRASFSVAHNNLTGCGGNTEEKQVALWERQVGTLRKLVKSFDQARPPDMLLSFYVSVIGSKSVNLIFQDVDTDESYACTKFKIQWSFKNDFSMIVGEKHVLNMKQKECQIDGLIQGQKYFFRACTGNLKGYSRFVSSSPPYVIPSCWRDIESQVPRFAGRLQQLDVLFSDIKRPEYVQDTPALQRRNHKKKTTIKQLFTATSKFQKNLRRGVYLACFLYHEDKVLVTNEDFLPVIEVDETYPSCIYNDFHWLMKVACTWDDVKILKHDMERSNGSPANHFRLKLLQAAAQMQTALCIQDLGQVYYKPIRDNQGTLVFSTINYIKSPKLVSVLNSRWLPLNKVTKKLVIHNDSNVGDILMASIQDQMTYHQLSTIRLSKGLYLGYLKMQSSVDLIQVVVPAKAPNFLPHFKIRENPHVSAEEWAYLKRIKNMSVYTNNVDSDEEKIETEKDKENVNDIDEKDEAAKNNQANEQQQVFIDLISATARRLFSYMEIGLEESLSHRLYDTEVIELTDEVSFLIIVPPAETACSVPGTREILLQRGDLFSLPIQVFEMVHLSAYQKDVIHRYSRLSYILELDTAHAQHNHREAFSSVEVSAAKDKLLRLEQLQTQLNIIWKGARWLIDVITFARDRNSINGISIKSLINVERTHKTNGLKRSLLQLPPRDPKLVKSSPGRGSWPGPNINNNSNNNINNLRPRHLLTTDFSKSEQHLTAETIISRDCRSREGNNDISNFSTDSEPIKPTTSLVISHTESLIKHPMPSSKSDDTLLMNQHRNISMTARATSGVSVSASTSPQFYLKPLIYDTPLLTDSDSLQSLNSDEISGSSHQHLLGSNRKKIKDKTLKIKSKKPTASVAAMASSILSSSSSSSLPMDTHLDDIKDHTSTTTLVPAPMPGILQVFAAYDTGLAAGTSLKLHVTPRTTAREVVDLVVKQLNMAVVLKGQEGPIYTLDELSNFCLVAVIGARERCLRDDFKPLQLQNPWKKGRLYVRLKQDVLAALEHSSKHTAYL